ncbi:MAG: class IV adenylate cyclase [Methanobacterium sp.]|nr:class IV adenylate cyclase [Methanobacterium sp.]
MLEVEVKAHISDFKEIKDKLVEIGAVKQRTEHQEDIYFNAPHRDFAQTDEALRIRKIPRKEGYEIILTYKGAKLDKSSKTRQEIEVKIEDSQKTGLILENLGFNPVKTIKKDRIIYLLDEFIITLDKVWEVGNFVEIERDLNEGEDYQEILDKIFDTYRILGINEGFERRSYLELLELGRK